MTEAEPFRITPRLIVGLGILTLGILWTLDNLQVLESEPITRWWPIMLIVLGLSQLTGGGRRARRGGPLVMIIVGSALLLSRLHFVHIDIGDLIPLGIALIGAKLIWEALGRGRHAAALANGDPDSTVHSFAIMSGIKHKSTSPAFRGGDANAIMGGVELDLRNAKIATGDTPILDVFAMWGAIEILVPPNWKVVGSVMPLMGAFVNNTRHNGEAGPTLAIQGTAVMGGVDVKN